MAQLRNTNALKHGATSDDRIAPVARNHRRRVLRQLGLSPRDLDPIGRGYLDGYCRTIAKVEAIDAYLGEHGLMRPDGDPQPVLKLYVSLVNSARLALARLEAHVRGRRHDPQAALAAYLDGDG